MRFVRIVTLVVFILVSAAWGVSSFSFNKNKDDVPPVIEAQSDHIQITTASGEEGLLQGMTATDNKDGDLSDQILIGKQSKFVKKGTTEVTYLVFDSSNNPGYYTREVDYVDYHSPEFHLSEPLMFEKNSVVTILDRMRVLDSVQGDISDKIKIVSSDVDSEEVGIYTMGVEVSNKFGDIVTVQLPINIVEKSNSEVELVLTNYFKTLNRLEPFDPEQMMPEIRLPNGSMGSPENMTVESNVDPAVPGTYQVFYFYEDEQGLTGRTVLTVLVRE